MNFITDIFNLHIDNLRCYNCAHYLSAKPILLSIPHGKNLCGRCYDTSKLVTRNYLFEILAKQFIFPCVYIEEGCIVRRPFQEMNKHEITCASRSLSCNCGWKGNPYEFKVHYEKSHKELVFKDGDAITLKENVCFLFTNSALYFFIDCKLYSNIFSIEITGLTTSMNECKVIFTCKLFEFNLDFKIGLNEVKQLPQTHQVPTITLVSEMPPESIEFISFSLTCPNCKIHMAPPILRCIKEHTTCIECCKPWLEYCYQCGHVEAFFKCDHELELNAALSIFPCRWNCGEQFNSSEIRKHEWSCEKRIYLCCHSWRCKWKGTFTELTDHYQHCCEIEGNCLLIINEAQCSFFEDSNNYKWYHLLCYNYTFDVTCEYREENIYISVDCADIYALGQFSFMADLIHKEDVDCPFNKTYKIKHSDGALYNLVIPEDDILQFGEQKPFKITCRLIILNEEDSKMKTDAIYSRKFSNYRRYC